MLLRPLPTSWGILNKHAYLCSRQLFRASQHPHLNGEGLSTRCHRGALSCRRSSTWLILDLRESTNCLPQDVDTNNAQAAGAEDLDTIFDSVLDCVQQTNSFRRSAEHGKRHTWTPCEERHLRGRERLSCSAAFRLRSLPSCVCQGRYAL